MLQIQAKENKCIDLGRRGEDSAREILFDISGWAELYGQGEAQLIAKRDKDLYSYPASIAQNDTTVSWVIKPVDNDQPGYGKCELVYITDGSVVKSLIYQTHTDVSLSDPISPPASPSTYGSLVKKMGDLDKLNTKDKSNLVSAINELVANSGGTVDDATIAKLVDKYLADNHITADDIGAIPAPPTAEVGQTMVVEEVNENGVPTKWRVSDLPTVPNALPNPHPLTIGDQTYDGSTAVNIKLPSGDSGGGRLLGEITLSEDVNGTIIIPLNDNPFLYGKLLIEMNAQRVDNGDGQYMGTIFGGTKKSSIFHLNTLFSADKTSTVWVMVDLFRDMVHSIATKKVDYMWLTNNQYSCAYEIDETQNASDNMLEISWCSAVSGATFKVWGK